MGFLSLDNILVKLKEFNDIWKHRSAREVLIIRETRKQNLTRNWVSSIEEPEIQHVGNWERWEKLNPILEEENW